MIVINVMGGTYVDKELHKKFYWELICVKIIITCIEYLNCRKNVFIIPQVLKVILVTNVTIFAKTRLCHEPAHNHRRLNQLSWHFIHFKPTTKRQKEWWCIFGYTAAIITSFCSIDTTNLITYSLTTKSTTPESTDIKMSGRVQSILVLYLDPEIGSNR